MAGQGSIRSRKHATRHTSPRFADPRLVDAEGLVGCGGELGVDWLLDAYSHGVFPWPINDDEPMLWWSPDPRAILELDRLHISRSLRRTLQSGKFTATADQDFRGVIEGCANGPGREDGTWITPAMREAYQRLHLAGHAHSVEVWAEEPGAKRLAGGVYGVAIGGLFAAESMFHYETDASKVALVHLVGHLRKRGYRLLDVQQWTEHTGRLGVTEIPRVEYLRRLSVAIEEPVTFGDRLEQATSGD